jgi:hypothetical protein
MQMPPVPLYRSKSERIVTSHWAGEGAGGHSGYAVHTGGPLQQQQKMPSSAAPAGFTAGFTTGLSGAQVPSSYVDDGLGGGGVVGGLEFVGGGPCGVEGGSSMPLLLPGYPVDEVEEAFGGHIPQVRGAAAGHG